MSLLASPWLLSLLLLLVAQNWLGVLIWVIAMYLLTVVWTPLLYTDRPYTWDPFQLKGTIKKNLGKLHRSGQYYCGVCCRLWTSKAETDEKDDPQGAAEEGEAGIPLLDLGDPVSMMTDLSSIGSQFGHNDPDPVRVQRID
jgi:hypothetical protein